MTNEELDTGRMKFCYLPENAHKLKALRQLERKQKQGRLTQGGLFQIMELKEQLRIGT
jgi:hypothetical protein